MNLCSHNTNNSKQSYSNVESPTSNEGDNNGCNSKMKKLIMYLYEWYLVITHRSKSKRCEEEGVRSYEHIVFCLMLSNRI